MGQDLGAQSPPHTRAGTAQNSSGLLFPSPVSLQTRHARQWQCKSSLSLEAKIHPLPPAGRRGPGCFSSAAEELISPSKHLRSPGVEKQPLRSEQRSRHKPWRGVYRRVRKQTHRGRKKKTPNLPPVTWQPLPPHPRQPPSSVCSVTAPHHPPGEHHGNTVVFKHRSLCCDRKQH